MKINKQYNKIIKTKFLIIAVVALTILGCKEKENVEIKSIYSYWGGAYKAEMDGSGNIYFDNKEENFLPRKCIVTLDIEELKDLSNSNPQDSNIKWGIRITEGTREIGMIGYQGDDKDKNNYFYNGETYLKLKDYSMKKIDAQYSGKGCNEIKGIH